MGTSRKRKKGQSRFFLGVSVFLFFLMLFFMYSSIFMGGKEVPKLVGMTESEAVDLIETSGWKVDLSYTTDLYEGISKGHVVSQIPQAGYSLGEGKTVKLVILQDQENTFLIPDLVGKPQVLAVKTLKDLGVRSKIVKKPYSDRDRDKVGLVLEQSPTAGSEATGETVVSLWVLDAPEKLAVPNVEGKSLQEAIELLESMGFEVELDGSPDLVSLVKEQDPARGEMLARGSVVRLIAQEDGGPAEVPLTGGDEALYAPLLEGRTVAEARAIATEEGFSVEVNSGVSGDAIVSFQSPPPGDLIRDRVVSLSVVESAVVPSLMSKTLGEAQIELERNGLSVGEISYVYAAQEGLVVGQEPRPGLEVMTGTVVQIVLGDPTLEDPSTSAQAPAPQEVDLDTPKWLEEAQ